MCLCGSGTLGPAVVTDPSPEEYARVIISGLRVEVLSGMGQNGLPLAIENVFVCEQDIQAGIIE